MQFEFTMEAAQHNSSLLEGYGFDLESFIKDNPNSTVSYGSELRPLDQLQPLLSHHPNFERFKQNLSHGIDYPISPLSDVECKNMLEHSLQQGNHKSALNDEHRPVVTKLMTQDVELGYGIPLTLEALHKMKQAEVYPIG